MIGTLFIQEFRSTRRSLLTSIGIAALVAVVSFAAVALRVPVLASIGLGFGMFAALAVLPLVLGLLVENYWRTMYGREGYFTMSLPVRGRSLFIAKVLYALVASLGAVAVTVILLATAAIAISLGNGDGPFIMIRDLLTQIGHGIELIGPAISTFLGAALLLQLVYAIIVGAALMSIGAQSRFNHLGFGAPVLGAVIMYFVMQVLGLAAMLFIPLGVRVSGPDAGQFVAEGMFSEFVRAIAEGGGAQPDVIGVGIVFLSIAVTALFAWRGAHAVERHTSLR